MKTPVIKIAKKGFDIRTANPKNLTIDSSKNQFKVIDSGHGTFSLNSGNDYDSSITVTHNLGYIPFTKVWVTIPEVNTYSPLTFKKGPWVTTPTTTTPYGTVNPFEVSITPSSSIVYIRFYENSRYFMDSYDISNLEYEYLIFVDPSENTWD